MLVPVIISAFDIFSQNGLLFRNYYTFSHLQGKSVDDYGSTVGRNWYRYYYIGSLGAQLDIVKNPF